MSFTKRSTICDTSDVMAAADALGGRFDREDCGFFEKCDHRVEKYDMTVPGGASVEIFYCSIDWKKTGPILLAVFVVMFLLYRRLKGVGSGMGSYSDYGGHSSGGSKYSKYYKARR